jgi:heme exporter protein A
VGAQAELPARSLSQGQKRRTALARLLFARAKLWVLDEPVAALDAGGVEWLAAALDRHLESGGLAVVTSHQPVATRAQFATLKLGA